MFNHFCCWIVNTFCGRNQKIHYFMFNTRIRVICLLSLDRHPTQPPDLIVLPTRMENFEERINYNNTNLMPYNILVWYFLPTVVMAPSLVLPINGLVIRLLLGKPGICSTSEIFTLTLAVFDVLFCFIFLAEYIRFVCFPSREASNMVAWCLNLAGGPMLQCFLSLDSYMAVCYPLVFIRFKDPKMRLSLCLVATVVTFVCCCLLKFSRAFKWSVISLIMFNATVIISSCSIQILRSLHSSGPGKKEVHPVKKRAFRIVLTSLVLINALYLPSILEYHLRTSVPQYFAPFSALTCVTYTFVSMGGFVQPLCYLVRTKQLPSLRCQSSSEAKTKTVATG